MASMKEYLKRYESNVDGDGNKKKKKSKKKSKDIQTSGVIVVDRDPVWQKPLALKEEQENDSPDEKPIVHEDIEVKRMRRLEMIRARRANNALADDGSGWVTLSPKHKSSRNDSPSPEDRSPSGNQGDGRHDSEDLSPPRKSNDQMKQASDEDLSPPRKRETRRHDLEDLSPPRKSNRDPMKGASDEDYSPPRRRQNRRHDSDDLSPPRKSNRDQMKEVSDEDLSPPRKQEPITLEFSKARPKSGLISGSEMRDEIMKTKREDAAKFEQMDPSISGKGAQVVYRDKKGNRISKEEHMKLNQKVEEKPKEKKIEWGVGLAQKREAEEKMIELELEKEKPFARTRDDPELDAMLKERVRWGDPMAHLVKKKGLEPLLQDLGNSEKMKESGFIIPQDVPAHSWIKRGIDAAPNRYGVRPGRHWDGVDRSTGFEKQLFKRSNEKRASESEAYIWSVADM